MNDKPIKIKDIDDDIVKNLEGFCLPKDKEDDPFFIEGTSLWRRWMKENLKKFDTIGKVAYQDSEIIGSIQYVPKSKPKLVEIKCVYAEDERRRHEVKKALLKETIKEFKKPKSYFGNTGAKALVAFPHPVPQDLGNATFYKTNGFKEISGNGYIFYYPLKKEYIFQQEEVKIPIEDLDKDKVMIYCNSSCPYCVKEMRDALELIRDMNKDVPIKLVIPFEEPEKLSTVFSMPVCMVVGDEVIGYSLLKDELFLKKLKTVLDSKYLPPTRKNESLNTKTADEIPM